MHLPLLFLLCVTGFTLNSIALASSHKHQPLTHRPLSESPIGSAKAEDIYGAHRTTLAIDDDRSDDKCAVRRHVQLEGRLIMESTNNIVRDPGACCAECRNRLEDCVGWMFRASYHGCALYSRVHAITECPNFDCEAGIIDEESLPLLTSFVDAPTERYRGLITTCGQKELYESITVVAAACSDVQRLCSPASKKVKQRGFDLDGTLPEILRDKNFFYKDYDNGFQEHTLTAEDCRTRCMRQRRCVAWARTQPGQCWLKHTVPKKDKGSILGDAIGRREPLEVQCGPHFRGVMYTTTDSDDVRQKSASSPEECCAHCKTTEQGCVVWSFVDGTCHMILNEVGTRERNDNAVSGFIVTAPLKCQEHLSHKDEEMMDIAAAYDVECASILEYGPGETRDECSGHKEAKRIFDRAVARLQDILSN